MTANNVKEHHIFLIPGSPYQLRGQFISKNNKVKLVVFKNMCRKDSELFLVDNVFSVSGITVNW